LCIRLRVKNVEWGTKNLEFGRKLIFINIFILGEKGYSRGTGISKSFFDYGPNFKCKTIPSFPNLSAIGLGGSFFHFDWMSVI